MALHKTQAVVVGRRALGESDRLVEFYTREFGKLRGVARSARRPRSRFGSALEPFTLGELVFFDTGRSDLVRVDHFDILHPFVGLGAQLERLGRAAWTVECVVRLSADRDPHEALLRLPLAPALEDEVCAVVEGMIARLAGQVPRSARFLAQMRRSLSRVAEPAPTGSRR